MKQQDSILANFRERFLEIAEEMVGMNRYDRGFLKEIKKSLRLSQLSTPQRWVEGSSMVRIKHLLTIYQRWGVTPNDLLGIRSGSPEKKKNSRRN